MYRYLDGDAGIPQPFAFVRLNTSGGLGPRRSSPAGKSQIAWTHLQMCNGGWRAKTGFARFFKDGATSRSGTRVAFTRA